MSSIMFVRSEKMIWTGKTTTNQLCANWNTPQNYSNLSQTNFVKVIIYTTELSKCNGTYFS